MKFETDDFGFTFIEVVVALAITATLMAVASSSFFYLLRGTSKVEIIKEVKQNGDYALSVMDTKIRNSRDITTSCSLGGVTSDSISIVNPDGSASTFDCVTDGNVRRLREQISVPSQPLQINYLTNASVSITNTCENSLLFICTIGSDNITKIVNTSISLTSTNASGEQISGLEGSSQSFNLQITLRN